MSNKDRIRLAIMNNCAVSFSVEHVPPAGQTELVTLALARKVRITLRDATRIPPQQLTILVTMANQSNGLLTIEF